MDPAISVIMAVHNGERYLKAAISSILKQSFKDFEFIIVNDGSTDRTGVCLSGIAGRDDRIRIITQSNQGLAISLNRALEDARGKYIARMDADDISIPHRLQMQYDVLRANSQVVCCGTSAIFVNWLGWSVGPWSVPVKDNEIRKEHLAGHPGQIVHPSTMMRRTALHSVGGYDERLKVAQDYDLWMRFHSIGELANLSELLLKYRIHDSTLSAERIKSHDTTVLDICNKYRPQFGLEPLDRVPNGETIYTDRSMFLKAKQNKNFHTAFLHYCLYRLRESLR